MDKMINKLLNRKRSAAVVGLGYVGMPIAVALSEHINVIGFDTNANKIEQYKKGIDPTNEVGSEKMISCNVDFTDDAARLKEASFIIIAVPTPVNTDHTPDLKPVESASHLVGNNLSPETVIVYESTVYPGVTEEICIPILERASGLKAGKDFKVGYSPERINPGDKVHRLDTITKIVSGMDMETLNTVAAVYELVAKAGVYKAPSIKVAEAAKVIENSQRDINIAFMNELSIIFHKMGIDTNAVLEAAATKWNFLKFTPGLVGGHCIGVDPYYLTYRAEEMGYHSQIILAGRRINDDMGKYVAENIIKCLINAHVPVDSAKVFIMGFTFKENCPDTRNTRVIDIVNELKEYNVTPQVYDPIASPEEVLSEYNITLCTENEIRDADALVIPVKHDEFTHLTQDKLLRYFNKKKKHVLIDVKGIFAKEEIDTERYIYWRL